ncbi:substrate-binding domain-containing protein, partial [Dactylosporangium matsuzakiense]|uniref:substrate-binding domain-containing protein n=1 Tax=Dactylosporangium matsuzakiense TaxID=53360 RepID=UPI0027955BC0
MVGSIVLDSANPFFAEVARAVEDRLVESGCMQLLFSSDLHVAREQQCLKLLEEHAVRGIIIDPVNPELDGLVRLSGRGTPVVLLDRSRGGADLCAVAADNVRGGELAAAHLLELGHRRIVFLGGSITVDTISARRAGAERACVSAGLDPGEVLVDIRHAPSAIDGPEAAVDHILALRPLPTAIICTNDTAAVGVLRGLRRAGVPVPAGMSVVGYDDVHFASELSPPLTTVRQAKASLGRAAADLLLAEGEPGHRHQELVFTPELIIRASTTNP